MHRQNMIFNEDETEETKEKKWYDEFPTESSEVGEPKPEIEIMELKTAAKKHLEAETAAYQLKESKSRDSELQWLKTALTKGTEADRIAASVVLIQNNPKYNLSRLVALISQVKASKPNSSGGLVASLRDLWLTELLHPERGLKKFEDRNFHDYDSMCAGENETKTSLEARRKKLLAHWYFEDQLAENYERFVVSLTAVAADSVEANREKAVAILCDLLVGNSEQEHKLLELLVNKIGDPSNKVASKVVFCANKLLLEHPNMKLVVMREIEKLLFRKNVAPRAQYYAICLLTQFVLDKNDTEVANSLIDIYFAFFKASLKRGEPDSRMMSAILTGVNRAYPFSNLDSAKLHANIDYVYKVVHIGSFNVSLNALSLLHQVVGKEPEQENRFYTTFYRKLLDPQIGMANKRAMFLNLLYRVLKKDKSVTRLYAFLKRIFQIALYFSASMTCATLYVVSQVLEARKDLRNFIKQGYRSIKIEEEPEIDVEKSQRNKELQPEVEDSKEEDCAKGKSKKKGKSKEGKNLKNNDKKSQIDENSIVLSNLRSDPPPEVELNDEPEEIKVETAEGEAFYDPFCLNPLRSAGIRVPLAELEALSTHYHPSVALFASTIVQGRAINYTGDPLEDLNLIRFLDRYVFKNPKKLDEKKITRNNDPLAQRAKYVPRGVKSMAVDSQAYVNEREDRIPVDELFLYRYLRKKNENLGKNADATDDEDDNDSVNSEEFNDMLDRLGGVKNDLDDLDIAADLSSSKKKARLAKQAEDDDEEEEDLASEGSDEDGDAYDDDEEGSDLDLEGGSDLDLDEGSDLDLDGIDEDLSDMDFDDEDELPKSSGKAKGKGKSVEKPGKKKKMGMDSNVFVAAEEFAAMLEEQGRSKRKHGGSNTLSDADGASTKQLDWEIGRNERLSGRKRPRNSGNFKKANNKSVKKFKRRF